MSERATNLRHEADRQIAELLELLSAAGEEGTRRPCPGREKLGDGTVGAVAQHLAHVYHLLAQFARTYGAETNARSAPEQHRRGQTHSEHHPSGRIQLHPLLHQLSAAGSGSSSLADLTVEQLDSVPAAGSFRFADGSRTLEQAITGVLNHQTHHLDALRAALAG